MNKDELLKSMSADERRQLLRELQQQDKEEREARRDAYEGLRAEFMQDVKNKLLPVVEDVKAFRDWIEKEQAHSGRRCAITAVFVARTNQALRSWMVI